MSHPTTVSGGVISKTQTTVLLSRSRTRHNNYSWRLSSYSAVAFKVTCIALKLSLLSFWFCCCLRRTRLPHYNPQPALPLVLAICAAPSVCVGGVGLPESKAGMRQHPAALHTCCADALHPLHDGAVTLTVRPVAPMWDARTSRPWTVETSARGTQSFLRLDLSRPPSGRSPVPGSAFPGPAGLRRSTLGAPGQPHTHTHTHTLIRRKSHQTKSIMTRLPLLAVFAFAAAVDTTPTDPKTCTSDGECGDEAFCRTAVASVP